MYVQLDTRPIEKGCREIIYLWKSSGLESAEQCERKSIKSHPRPNLVFAQFSVVCVFNWMLGQLRKGYEKIVYSWKNSELKSAEQREKIRNLALSPIQYSRNSQSYVYSIRCSAT